METYRLIPVPEEEYDALGITENSIIETYINNNGALVINVLHDKGDFICEGDCDT